MQIVPYSNKTHINSRAWERGKLTKKSVYNSDNVLVSQTNIGYSKLKEKNSNVSQSIFQFINGHHIWMEYYFLYCNNPNYGVYDGFTYQVRNLEQLTGIYRESSRTETLYENGLAFTTTTEKTYDPEFLQLIREEVRVSSNPDVIVTNYRYPFQLVNDSSSYTGYPVLLQQMVQKNMLSPIEQYTVIQNSDGAQPRVIAGNLTRFKNSGTYLVPENMYFLELETPLPLNNFSPQSLSGISAVTYDQAYKLRVKLNSFDTNGNPNEIQKTNHAKQSYLWGYGGSYVIAEARNAGLSEIAYTSFETDEKGGWTYSGSNKKLMRNEAKAGRSAYDLSAGAISRMVSGASSSNKFKLSFWAKVPSGTQTWSFLGQSESLSTDWKLIEREISQPELSISGSNILVDEIRIHPMGAEMNTFTYLPGIGQWSQMDVRNQAVYYQYDRLGRLESIFNNDSQMVSHYEYSFIK